MHPSFKDQIAATGFIFFITNTSIYVTAVGKAVPGDLVVTKYVDNASPVLAQAASSGQPFQQAILSVLQPVRGEEKVFYTIILQDVRVSGIVQSGASITPSGNPGAVPTEVVSLRYASVQWQVGSTKAGYDFSTNKKSDVHPNAAPQDLQAGIPSKTLAVSLPVRALK